jgi:hypothetical protein
METCSKNVKSDLKYFSACKRIHDMCFNHITNTRTFASACRVKGCINHVTTNNFSCVKYELGTLNLPDDGRIKVPETLRSCHGCVNWDISPSAQKFVHCIIVLVQYGAWCI